MKTLSLTLLGALMLTAGGCIINHEGYDCYGDGCGVSSGDLGFYWAFELPGGQATDSCIAADVARLNVRIYDDFGDLEYAVMDRPCGDLGLDMTNFYEGWYELQLTARCSLGSITHEGWYDVYIEGGAYNDLGVLELPYLRPCY